MPSTRGLRHSPDQRGPRHRHIVDSVAAMDRPLDASAAHNPERYGAEMTTGDLAIVLAVVAAASVVQATAGFGFALTAMPLLSTTIGAEHGLAIVSTVALFNSGTTWWTSRGEIHKPSVRAMTAASIVGMPAGLWLLDVANERVMRAAIALSVAVVAMLLAFGFRLRRPGRRADWIAGWISGALSTSTGTSGPPLVFTLRARDLPAATVRATLAAEFVLSGVVSLALLAAFDHVDRADLKASLLSLPVLLVSWRAGAAVFRRMGQNHYDRLVIVMLLSIAMVSLLRAL